MKEELKGKEVLAMYDVRGIQSYIFKTNAVKEIIGASYLVEDLIGTGLRKYIKENNLPEDKYIVDWKYDKETFIKNSQNKKHVKFLEDLSVQMEVMFIGGGNAYVIFRDGAECEKVNQFLAKYVLEETYSLNLAVAVVKKGDTYKNKDNNDGDYDRINTKLREIKAEMPSTQPVGALPFMDVDNITGYPITDTYYDAGSNKKYTCRESWLKREKTKEYEKRTGEKIGEKIFDEMVTEKGSNSTLALVHIDGNSMGSRIKDEMGKAKTYDIAIPTMRGLSDEISNTFKDVFNDMCDYIDKNLADKVKKLPEGKHLYRKIVLAGDDITFVCNGKVAIPAVKFFLEKLGEKKGGYSACGGIAFFNSHFPFSDAYEVAEACCGSAKSVAKKEDNRISKDKVGCFFDYQICTNVRAAELSSYRAKNYEIKGENKRESFIARPYFVVRKDKNNNVLVEDNKLNNNKEIHSVEKLYKWLEYFTKDKIARNKAKGLRNAIPSGENALTAELNLLKSRGIDLQKDKDQYKIWYDALEIMDLYIDENNKEA